jgi:hypothetical protein
MAMPVRACAIRQLDSSNALIAATSAAIVILTEERFSPDVGASRPSF